MTTEIWKPIQGYNSHYEISSFGRVRSSARGLNARLLKPGVASNGYPTVALGRKNTRTLHSLVAEAFLGPRPEGQEVRHIDGNRRNPAAANLCYGTRTQNIYDAIAHGTWFSDARVEHIKKK